MGISDAYMDAEGLRLRHRARRPLQSLSSVSSPTWIPPLTPPGPTFRRIVPYEGGDIVLNEAEHIVMKEADFPSLARNRGKHLIVTDGTTLWGPTTRPGLRKSHRSRTPPGLPEPHATLRIGFTPR